jgi:nickel superoxide dismutase
MNEHAETLMKSMKQIVELSKAAKPDMNQIVRWTTTKDSHADDIINICAQYFLCQRIKPAKDAKNEKEQNAYLNKLELVHKLMITAMKCKQGTDTKNVDELKKLIHDFSVAYEGAAHKHKH